MKRKEKKPEVMVHVRWEEPKPTAKRKLDAEVRIEPMPNGKFYWRITNSEGEQLDNRGRQPSRFSFAEGPSGFTKTRKQAREEGTARLKVMVDYFAEEPLERITVADL